MLVGGCKLVYKRKKNFVYGMDLIKQNKQN